jgi:hypothetical protein
MNKRKTFKVCLFCLLLIAEFFALSLYANADTNVSGFISSNTTWRWQIVLIL